MSNREIASILFTISAILETLSANPYRIRAYRRAARIIQRTSYALAERAHAGQPLGIPGLGESLTAKITALARGEPLPFYDELRASLPISDRALLTVPGIGPRLAARVRRDLGVFDAGGLRRAASTGALRRVLGIGPKRAAAIVGTLAPPAAQQLTLSL
jgi:DNA polymerase (family X)